MLINPGIVTLQEASLPVLLIGRRIVAISIPRTNRENNTILLDCVSHYNSYNTSLTITTSISITSSISIRVGVTNTNSNTNTVIVILIVIVLLLELHFYHHYRVS